MRSPCVVAALAVSLCVPGVGRLAAQASAPDTRPSLAVMPFDNGGSYGQDQEAFEALQRGLAAMLISELAQNPAAGVIEREELERLVEQQHLGAARHADPPTAAKLGKLVGARYVVLGSFVDFYGDVRVDVRLVNVATRAIVKVEKEEGPRDHLYRIIATVAGRLMRDANLPPLRQPAAQRASRQIPTEALTYYARALLYQDRGQKDKAVEMYERALAVFPQYAEARQGLERVQAS